MIDGYGQRWRETERRWSWCFSNKTKTLYIGTPLKLRFTVLNIWLNREIFLNIELGKSRPTESINCS